MNEKKSLQDLCGKISEDAGVSKKTTDSFLRTLFDVIEEALKRDGIVKIPEFGTFKLVQVEQRKSVNVRTKEEIIIPAYQKVSFTPTKEVKDKVNLPFAHLLTYTIRQDGPVDPPEIDEETEEGGEEAFSDFSSDEKNVDDTLIVEEKTDLVSSEPLETTFNADPDKELEGEKTDDTVVDANTSENNTIEKTIDNENEKSMDLNDDKKEFESSKTEEVHETEQTALVEEPQVKETRETEESETKETSTEEKNEKQEDPKKNKKWLLWLLLLLVVVLAVLFGAKYAIDNHLFGLGSEPEQTEVSAPVESNEVDTFFDENATDEAEKTDVSATEDDEFEEQQEPIDCYETPEKCTTDIQPLESGEKSPLNMHEFDPDLVSFMHEKHPELNFQSTAVVREVYTVKEGSRLAQISRNLYGDAFNFWVYIYYFNTDVLAKPDDVKAGMKLKVPDLGSDYVDPTSQKCKRLANEVAEHLLNQK